MMLVVDANIVFSSLISGKLTGIFLSEKLELIAPELLLLRLKNTRKK